jgi:hypothetical protein
MDASARYGEIADDLAARNDDVVLGQMMGMPAIKSGGKMIGGLWEGEMVFKLPDVAQREAALALAGTRLFDPGKRGAPMKEWVTVPSKHAAAWPRLVAQALAARRG